MLLYIHLHDTLNLQDHLHIVRATALANRSHLFKMVSRPRYAHCTASLTSARPTNSARSSNSSRSRTSTSEPATQTQRSTSGPQTSRATPTPATKAILHFFTTWRSGWVCRWRRCACSVWKRWYYLWGLRRQWKNNESGDGEVVLEISIANKARHTRWRISSLSACDWVTP